VPINRLLQYEAFSPEDVSVIIGAFEHLARCRGRLCRLELSNQGALRIPIGRPPLSRPRPMHSRQFRPVLLLRAMFDVGYFPPNTPPPVE
jgi:hypothetical protein